MSTDILFRKAQRKDLEMMVRLLADDALGKTRESVADTLPEAYVQAFHAIDRDEHHDLWVVDDGKGMLLGVLQLTFLPSLTYGGRWRAQIEGVRIHATMRGKGLGKKLFEHAIGLAKERQCCMVQLTTDKRRPKAFAFYETLGFKASHEGMKLHL